MLELLRDHNGVLLSRVRAIEPGDRPAEVHVVQFRSQDCMDAYLVDPRRAAMAVRRNSAILRTETQLVLLINGLTGRSNPALVLDPVVR